MRSPDSDRLLAESEALLREAGLLAVERLDQQCPQARTCWRGARAEGDPQRPRLPWVGPGYGESRVVVVGLNALTHAGLYDEHHCVVQAESQFALGRKRFAGVEGRSSSWFHYRSAAAAGLLLSIVDGVPPIVVSPADAMQPLLRSARLQLVQCAPGNDSRRAPTGSMVRSCPTIVAWPTLDLLKPRLVALLGAEARRSFESRYDATLSRVDPLLQIGEAHVAGRNVSVVALRHPSSGFGGRSLEVLRSTIAVGRFPG